jgi:hypothetical protein
VANGDIVLRDGGELVILLLDSATTGSTNNGVWCECPAGFGMGTVVVNGPATTTVVSVNAADDLVQPTAATVGAVVTAGAAGTGSFTSFPVLPRWVKAAITATGTGTVVATLHARRVT